MIKGRKKSSICISMITLVIFISACQPNSEPSQSEQSKVTPSEPTELVESIATSPMNSPVATPQPTPTLAKPAAGKAALQGVLFSNVTDAPIGGTNFYLTPGVGEQGDQMPPLLAGPQAQDIEGKTGEQGDFVLTDIPPGKYYMIIWAPLSWVALADPSGVGDSLPILLELEADQTLDLGQMSINWP